jgi:methanogenic corrinoid protein MtbC1
MPTAYERTSLALERRREALADAIVARHWQLQPELATRYDAAARSKCVRDVGYNLIYLSHAVRANEPSLFVEYLAWLKVLFARLDIPPDELAGSLHCMRDVLAESLPPDEAAVAGFFLGAGLHRFPFMPTSLPSYLDADAPYAPLARRYLVFLLKGERQLAAHLIHDAVAHGTPIRDLYLAVFQPCLREIGRLWQANEISVAQEHFCTAATQNIMAQLYAHIFTTPRCGRRLVAACVGQELHEVGLRMVADLFELAGWDTYYLGANTPADSIVATLAAQRADVLALSATMTFHLGTVAGLIAEVRRSDAQRNLHRPLKIMVGGYPFNVAPDLWRGVGADGYAPDAVSAIDVATQLLAEG